MKFMNRVNQFGSAILLVLCLYTSTIFAQNTGGPVGSLEGGASVSLDGAATYSVPIKIPKGVNGVQPSLSLIYNSRVTDGNAGWGWSLKGLSGISRGNQTKFYNGTVEPIKMNADDNFYLDGQLLMPVTGSNGGNGTVYQTEAQTYAKIESFGSVPGDPDWWRLTSKDGSVTEYGKNTAERMRADGNFIWLLSSAQDVSSNTVTYSYTNDGSEVILSTISYANISVTFEYGVKENQNVAFINGVGFKNTKLLKGISINLDGVRQISYRLNHEAKIKRNYLQSVDLVGTDNSSAITTSFNYGAPENEESYIVKNGGTFANPYWEFDVSSGDFNSDGKTDVILQAKSPVYESRDYTKPPSSAYMVFSNVNDQAGGSLLPSKYELTKKYAPETYVESPDAVNPYSLRSSDFNGNGNDGVLRTKMLVHRFQDSRGNWHTDRDWEGGTKMFYTDSIFVDEFATGGTVLTAGSSSIGLPYSYSNSKIYNFYPKESNGVIQGDFDGDGKTDVISILGYKVQTGERVEEKRDCPIFCGWYVYNRTPIYSYSYKAFFTNESESIINSEILGFDGTLEGLKAVYPLDIDGDGKQEFITFYGSMYIVYAIKPLPITSGYRFQLVQLFTASNIYYNGFKQILLGDYNGDRKTDVLGLNTSQNAQIFYSTGNSFQSGNFQLDMQPEFMAYDIYSSPHPTDLFFTGDFNGDGITDLYQSHLVKVVTTTPVPGGTSTTTEFKSKAAIHYFKGANYTPAIINRQTDYVCESQLWYYTNYTILETYPGGCSYQEQDPQYPNDPPITHYEDQYLIEYDAGTPPSITPLFTKTGTSEGGAFITHSESGHRLLVGDFNGDGRSEMLFTGKYTGTAEPQGLEHNQYRIISGYNSDPNSSLLQNITDGFGNITKIDYQSLSEKGPATIYTTTGTLSSSFPITVQAIPIKVVKTMQSPDGIGGNVLYGTPITRNYTYENAVIDRQKGFLGFGKFTTSSNLGDMSESISELNYSYRTLLPQTANTYLNDTLISSNYTNNTIVPLSNTSPARYYYFSRFKVLPTNSIERNLVSGGAIKRELSYDGYDNVTQQVIKTGYWNGSDITVLETATTVTQYAQTGQALIPIYPTQITVSNTKGSGTANRISTFTYTTDKGLLQSKTEWATTPLAATSSYTYNSYGKIVQLTSSIPGKPTVTTAYTYDATQRFINTTVVTCDTFITTSSVNYHPLWGVPLSETDGDGSTGTLTTTYEYNALGKRIKTTTPLGHQILESDVWDIWHVPGIAAYYHFKDYPDGVGADEKVWYDRLGRVIKIQTLGWNNKWITKTMSYDNKGRELASTAPYYDGEEILTSTKVYGGPLNKLSATITPHGTSTLGYSYPGDGQIIITSTTTAGQVSSSKTDATGQTVETTDHGGNVTYTYDERGNQLATVVNGVTMMVNTYDSYGRKIQLVDANAGTITYEYDAVDRLTKQTDANGKITTITYDGLGRILTRTTVEGTTTYEYYNTPNNKLLRKISNANHSRETFYDEYRRVVKVNSRVSNLANGYINFDGGRKTFEYDSNGNLWRIRYPWGSQIQRFYNNAGILSNISHVIVGKKIRMFEALDYDGLGHATRYKLVNGRETTKSYDKGLATHYYTPGIQDLYLNFELTTGNLLSRTDATRNLTETFAYDDLNRLTSAAVNGMQQFALNYDGTSTQSLGNIKSKSDIGNYTYLTNKPNAVAYVSPMATASPLINDINLNVSYSSFHRPTQIAKGTNSIALTYGVDGERVKTEQNIEGVGTKVRAYVGDYEHQDVRNVDGSGLDRWLIYISSPAGLCGIIMQGGSPYGIGNQHFAVYTDHLGSITAVTDSFANVVAQQNFDAWGRKRNVNDWSYNNVQTVPDWLYRGYTGHEQLDEFGLINMNARLYDPYTGRMLSADNYSTGDWGTQGFNRYSYANNNPLKFTDPSGNVFGWDDAAVAVFGGILNIVTNWETIKQGNFWTGVSYFVAGAAQGVATYYGGPIVGGIVGAGLTTIAGSIGTNRPVDWNVVGQNAMMGAVIGGVSASLGSVIDDALSPVLNTATKGLGQIGQKVAVNAATGAAVGATVGAITAPMSGVSVKDGALNGLTMGAVQGAATGLAQGIKQQLSKPKGVAIPGEIQSLKNPERLVYEYLERVSNGEEFPNGAYNAEGYVKKYFKENGINIADSYNASSIEYGNDQHRLYRQNEVDGINTFKEHIDPKVPGAIVDFVNYETRTIYELKPFNGYGLREGASQLYRYKLGYEAAYGGEWKVVLDFYK